ncbi:MAG: hypothetical protein ABIO29_01905 [Sphingomicrobium sp.]
MDDYRDFPSEFELGSSEETDAPTDTAMVIGTDERRMHVRAYNYWASLLDGRDFPSIEELEPGDVKDFSPNSLLLDFTCGRDNPAIPYIGGAIREECGLGDDVQMIADVPSRSLLSRLTDHYLEIVANRAPVGFEAEFENQRSETICYRGILMPFSSDGDTIDFIYGVINWKKNAEAHGEERFVPPAAPPAQPVAEDPACHSADHDRPEGDAEDEDDGGNASEAEAPSQFGSLIGALGSKRSQEPKPELDEPRAPPRFAQPAPRAYDFDPAPFAEVSPLVEIELIPPELGDDAALADRLVVARETAEAVKAGEGRTRAALYDALAQAYEFALAARDDPADYAELLADSGVKSQARAPMTPIVKLVFGIDYDKARLTEFAAALSFADRNSVDRGQFAKFIAGHHGGLKGMVAAERQARRPDAAPKDRGELARERLRAAPALTGAEFAEAGEYSLVVMRRGPDGALEPVGLITDPALVDRAIRKIA